MGVVQVSKNLGLSECAHQLHLRYLGMKKPAEAGLA